MSDNYLQQSGSPMRGTYETGSYKPNYGDNGDVKNDIRGNKPNYSYFSDDEDEEDRDNCDKGEEGDKGVKGGIQNKQNKQGKDEKNALPEYQDAITVMITVIKTIILCAVFMVTGPALILMNKYIMQDLDFPYPLFLSGLGILCSGITARVIVFFNYAQIELKEEVEGVHYYRRVLPVGVAFAGTLATGNMVYLLLDVGLIQMLKSFTPVVVMFFLFLTGIETPNKPVIISILIISFGTALTCSYTPDASVLGMFVMLFSEIFEAIRLVLTQFLLKDMKMGVVEGKRC